MLIDVLKGGKMKKFDKGQTGRKIVFMLILAVAVLGTATALLYQIYGSSLSSGTFDNTQYNASGQYVYLNYTDATNTSYFQNGTYTSAIIDFGVTTGSRNIKKQGFLAGMGAHSLEVVKACEKEGLPVDYYVKTFHNDNYWSAHPESERVEFSVDTNVYEDHNMIHDNIFDLFPVKTTQYMKEVRKPWIAYKVLAGGAILPKDGFRFAFENGADFICVGMFDFQVVDNVNTANMILGDIKKREREWFS